MADIVLDKISLDYTETLMAAAGHQAEEALHATMTNHAGEYLMLVEGSIPTENKHFAALGEGAPGKFLKRQPKELKPLSPGVTVPLQVVFRQRTRTPRVRNL